MACSKKKKKEKRSSQYHVWSAFTDVFVVVDAVTLIILGVIEPALLIIAASLPELRDFVWKHPKPVRYNNDEFNFQNNRLDYSEYEYARRQYMEAGGKSTFSYGSDVARPTPNFKLGPWI